MSTTKKRYWYTFSGERYSVYAKNSREAGELIAKKKQELEEGWQRSHGDMLVKDWAGKCLEAYKTNVSPQTRAWYEQVIKAAILPHIGNLPLSAVRPIDCQGCLNKLEGKSKSYIHAADICLKFIFHYAVLNGKIKTDPTESIIKPRGTEEHRRALTPEERAAVLDVAPKRRDRWVYLLMMLCGCRPGEAAEAKSDDISEVLSPDGELVHLLHIRGEKTKNANRYVPIPASLYDLIKDVPPGEYISLTRAGKKHGKNWRRHFAALKKDAGLGDDLVPYCLRHEYGTECARRGLDVRVTMRLMGHATIRMTAEVYTNLDQSDILHAASVLSGEPLTDLPTAETVENT